MLSGYCIICRQGFSVSSVSCCMFGWLMKDKADICFLQESYSTPEVEKIWKSQWKGELFFSHGTEHGKISV